MQQRYLCNRVRWRSFPSRRFRLVILSLLPIHTQLRYPSLRLSRLCSAVFPQRCSVSHFKPRSDPEFVQKKKKKQRKCCFFFFLLLFLSFLFLSKCASCLPFVSSSNCALSFGETLHPYTPPSSPPSLPYLLLLLLPPINTSPTAKHKRNWKEWNIPDLLV